MKHLFKVKWPIILPHFSHIFPAWPRIKLLIWIIVLIVFALNVVYSLIPPNTEEKRLRLNVMKNPFSVLPHQNLANYYLNSNLDEAEYEFSLAENYYKSVLSSSNNTNFLGAESSPLTTWNNLINYKENIIEELTAWKKLMEKYPQYEYIQLKISALYYQAGEYEEAKLILQKLLRQNPTLDSALLLYSKLN